MNKKLLVMLVSVCLALTLAVPLLVGCAGAPAPSATTETPTTTTPTTTPTETGTATVPKPAAGDVITWTLYDQLSRGSVWMSQEDTIKEFNRRVWEGTNHRLKIEWVFPGEHPYKGSEMLRPLQEGVCDMAATGIMQVGDEPLFAAISAAGLPFLMPEGDYEYSKELTFWIKEQDFVDQAYDSWNAEPLINFFYGGQHLYMKDTPVTGPDSLKGKRIRSGNSKWAKLIEMLGGEPVNVAWGETFTALSTGLVDGLGTSFSGAYNMGMIDQATYVSWLNSSYSPMMLAANKDSLAALPDDVREAFLATLYDLEDWLCDGEIQDNLRNLERSLFTSGTIVQTIPLDWREDLRAQAYENIWKSEIERGGEASWEIWDKIVRKMIADGHDVPGYTLK